MIYEEEDNIDTKVEFIGEKLSKDLKVYKVIIIGRYGVGKTSIIHKIINNMVQKEYEPTMSIDIKYFQIKVNNEIILVFGIVVEMINMLKECQTYLKMHQL